MRATLILVSLIALTSCGPSTSTESKPAAKPSAASTNEGSLVTAPVDYVSSVIRAGEQAKGTVEIATIQKAIDAFQEAEGRLPASLDEVAQKSYLNPMPKPPVGKEFAYDAATGKVQLAPAN